MTAAGRGLTTSSLDALWDFGDPKGSEIRFRRFVQQLRGDARRDLYAEAITQLARSQALQRKFRTAHRTLETLVPALPKLPVRARARYFLERGRVFNSGGTPRKALPLFISAWRLARESGDDVLAVDAAHMVALVKSGADQMRWNERALDLAERSGNRRARRWRASLLNNIGWSQSDAGAYRQALRSFRRAVTLRQRQGVPNETRIARWCVAKTLRLMGRTKQALAMQQRLLRAYRRARSRDGYVFEELGECLLTLGRTREARGFFRRAHAELSKDPWLVGAEPKRLKRLRELGAGR